MNYSCNHKELKEKRYTILEATTKLNLSYIHLFPQGNISQKRVTDLQLEDFIQYGPQNEQGKVVALAEHHLDLMSYDNISNLGQV